jgi:chromosome segregation ATPase
VALKSEVTSKEEQIQHLTDANQSLESEMQDLKLKASTFTKELKVLTSGVSHTELTTCFATSMRFTGQTGFGAATSVVGSVGQQYAVSLVV